MEFELLDWELEARRVARAFGMEGEFVFEIANDNNTMRDLRPVYRRQILGFFKSRPRVSRAPLQLPAQPDIDFQCHYFPYCRTFAILPDYQLEDDTQQLTLVAIFKEAEVSPPFMTQIAHPSHALLLARGLQNLDLLTPEIEAALGVSVGADGKVEPSLEYESRYGL